MKLHRVLPRITPLLCATALSGCCIAGVCFSLGDLPNPGPRGLPRSPSPTFGAPTGLTFEADTDGAGLGTGYTITFDVAGDTLQGYFASVALPKEYRFNGFNVLGPEQTQIGTFSADIDFDGTPELVTPLRSSTPSIYASVDLDRNGKYTDGVDPDIVVYDDVGSRFIEFTLGTGGDRDPNVDTVVAFRATLEIRPGIFTNPRTPDTYSIDGQFTSVDPDTGGENDGQGQSPLFLDNQMVMQTITPSALSILDPLLCYKTRFARGTICAADAPKNPGDPCSAEIDCGGNDGTSHCVKNKGPQKVEVLLDDALDTRAYLANKGTTVCSPGSQHGDGTLDTSTHLRGYKMKPVKKSCSADSSLNAYASCATDGDCGTGTCIKTPKHEKQRLILHSALGVTVVETKKPVETYLPTNRATNVPASIPGDVAYDAYSCYSAKQMKKYCVGDPDRACKKDADCGADAPCFKRTPKGLGTQFDDGFSNGFRGLQLKKPKHVCVAAGLDGDDADNPDAHLLCMSAKPLKKACGPEAALAGAKCRNDFDCDDRFPTALCQEQTPVTKPKGLFLRNSLGHERVDLGKEIEVCFPAVLG